MLNSFIQSHTHAQTRAKPEHYLLQAWLHDKWININQQIISPILGSWHGKVFTISTLTFCSSEKEGGVGVDASRDGGWCPALCPDTGASRRVTLWHQRGHKGGGNRHDDTWMLKIKDHSVILCTVKRTCSMCKSHRAQPRANGMLKIRENIPAAFPSQTSTTAAFLTNNNISPVG